MSAATNGLLSEDVYNRLLSALMTSKLKPGERLNRREVAKDLGVSVAPVLEAMTRLEWEGFLETRPRQGTRVREVDTQEVRGRFVLREAIEVQAARLYCGEPVRASQQVLLRLARRVDATNPFRLPNWRAEIRFHRALVELARCPVLLEAFDAVMRHSLFYAVNRLLAPPVTKIHPDAHEQLVRELLTDSPDTAEKLMRAHIQLRFSALQSQSGSSVSH